MTRITSLEDLRKLRNNLQDQMKVRENSQNTDTLVQVKVAMATCGIASGAKEVMDYLVDELDKRNIEAVVTQTGCMGYCYAEPTIEVKMPGTEPVIFGWVDLKKADTIIEKYIRNNELVEGIIPNKFISIE
jgi:NADP-reducing hydrogenase subunit HndB